MFEINWMFIGGMITGMLVIIVGMFIYAFVAMKDRKTHEEMRVMATKMIRKIDENS